MKREFYRLLSCALLSVASYIMLQAMQETPEQALKRAEQEMAKLFPQPKTAESPTQAKTSKAPTINQTPSKVPSLQTQALNTFLKNLLEGTFEEKSLPAILKSIPVELKERLHLEEEIKKGAINKGEPVKSYNSSVGHVTNFSDGSKRIDNYLGIGDTLYLSKDLQRYLQTDAAGNVRVNSLDKELVGSIPRTNSQPQTDMYNFPHGIKGRYYFDKTFSNNGLVDTPSLKLIYPENYQVTFKVKLPLYNDQTYISIDEDHYPLLLNLHEAITNLNKNTVAQVLREVYSNQKTRPDIPALINYIFVTDDALHRAIKKGLTATGKQLDDAKAIIKMLILAGADINKRNIDSKTALQLAEPNPELRKIILQAPLLAQTPALQQDLLIAIRRRDKAQVENIIKRAQNRGILDEVLNIGIGIEDVPLVVALKQAFAIDTAYTEKAYTKPSFDIAQLLINNGATLNNFYGKEFLDRYGKQYQKALSILFKSIK